MPQRGSCHDEHRRYRGIWRDPSPEPRGLVVKKRIEDVCADCFGYPCARVADLRDNPGALLRGPSSDADCKLSVVSHGLDCIDEQIEEELP